MKALAEKCPLHEAVNDMVIRYLPNPLNAQEGRVNAIWHGDKKSAIGESMRNADAKGDLAFMVTDISMDPHAGEVATGRLFSGSLTRGMEVYVSGAPKTNRIQQVGIFMGPERLEVDVIPAGNIAAVTGLKDAIVGSTATTLEGMTPFESISSAKTRRHCFQNNRAIAFGLAFIKIKINGSFIPIPSPKRGEKRAPELR